MTRPSALRPLGPPFIIARERRRGGRPVGAVRALTALYAVAAVATGLSTIWLTIPVFVVGMLALGMGNGSAVQASSLSVPAGKLAS